MFKMRSLISTRIIIPLYSRVCVNNSYGQKYFSSTKSANAPRDFSVPYTEAELDELRVKFRKLPTYKPGGWVQASDIPAIIDFMEFPRTPDQVRAYQQHWETHSGGILTMEHYIESASLVHSTAQFAMDYAKNFDINGDGVISRNEFVDLMKLMEKHDPRIVKYSYKEFLRGADVDENGVVSVVECAKWLENHIAEEAKKSLNKS